MSLEDKIKTYAKQYDLSDFHIRSNQPLALRENGSIVVNQEDIISREDIETFWKGNLNKSQLQEIVNNRDLDFAVVVGDFRYRVNGYYSSNGPCMVLRKIVSDIPQMEKLGLPDAVKEAIKLKNGLILVTGQTGSGKSTSLAAMIDQINSSRAENIITIEDPIEFVHPSKKSIISQREVGKDTGSFARALKSALRQDPDVILVGEMRDLRNNITSINSCRNRTFSFWNTSREQCLLNSYKNFRCFPSLSKNLGPVHVSWVNQNGSISTTIKKKGWRKNWLF